MNILSFLNNVLGDLYARNLRVKIVQRGKMGEVVSAKYVDISYFRHHEFDDNVCPENKDCSYICIEQEDIDNAKWIMDK